MSRQAVGFSQSPFTGYNGDISCEEKQPGLEADCSPPTNANVNNAATSPLPSYTFNLYTGELYTYSTSDTTYYSCVVN